ncbi:MAG: radical SAM protein, partial [Acidobacteria bacterium]
TPWSTLDDYVDLLDFIERESLIDHLDPVQLAIRLLIPPGSLLAGRAETKPFLGPLDPERFTFTWDHPDARVDRLYRDVGAIVERAAHDGEDPLVTFHRIRARAGSATSGSASSPALALPAARRDKGRPPRLTEPWFC